MRVETFTVGPFQENCYLVIDDATKAAVLVDPGEEGDRLVAAARRAAVRIDAIWVTHAHLDHVGGIAAVKRAVDAPVYLHADDLPLYRIADRQAAAYGVAMEAPPPPDRTLVDGQTLTLGNLRFTVLHAPGHAPGHVVIHGEGVAFCGDCIFAGSIGRTDLPMSDGRRLAASLARIAELPPDTVLYPGHGPPTTIAEELRTNPFLNGSARVVGF
jgi:glyoxylase-like metal-dependent hydrolase (beta-lactamase superfamily II)